MTELTATLSSEQTHSPYLDLPLRNEAEVAALRDRADLYERVLGFDEARARYVASRTFDERVGHWFSLLAQGPTYAAPATDAERATLAAFSLHPDVGAHFWHHEHSRLVDLAIVLDELLDERPSGYWIDLRGTRADVDDRIKRARALALCMERESDRRSAAVAA
jgi:hypothetical protein